MITLLHGENIVASRNELQNIKDNFKGEIIVLDGKKLTETDFIQVTQSNSMFENTRLVVLEGLVKFDFKDVSCDVVIWEDKKVTPPVWVVAKEFKITATIWKFLDNMTVPSLRQVLRDNDAQFIFLMIVRKYRLEKDTKKLKTLLEIDYQFKTGQLATDFPTAIELFILGL
ncbi:hypothetical protein HY310_01625 [Candidatus Microgenomates bacterium]|nr:hypothetical protein [Candidatus Microgenomates bacterium]